MADYSVLMSVYDKEQPEYLQASIQSMLDQTIPPDDFVIVCDGPLNDELDAVLQSYAERFPCINIVRLEQNVGIGAAANIGLAHVKHELVAKMDSDDISVAQRCEKELNAFTSNEQLALIGSYLSEFEDDPSNIVSIRKVPCDHAEIKHYARRRSPFNNQTVMYKKSVVLSCGGYSDLKRAEDYDLFVRILAGGHLTRNLPEALVLYRLAEDAIKRRCTFEHLKGFIKVRWRIYRMRYSNLLDFIIPTLAQLVLMILPRALQKKIYNKLRTY